jgi:hypothetical protein
MDDIDQPTGFARRPGGDAIPALLSLAWLAWAIGTPFLWLQAMLLRATWFGEVPEPSELRASVWLLRGALACGFAVPCVGLVLTLATRRRAMAVLWAIALGLSVAAGVAAGTVPDGAGAP